MKEGSTPIRRQYLRIKQRHPEAIVFFRLGDFYEAFDEDAKVISKELEIVLTSRSMGKGQRFPMAGIPHFALDSHLAKLIGKGHKVAICEQTTDPKTAKGLVEREVVRVVTPGTVVEPNLLDAKANNYLASMVQEGEQAGVAYVDVTTGEFATTQLSTDRAAAELERLNPSEIIVARESELARLAPSLTLVDDQWFELALARDSLLRHFGVATLDGYGCDHLALAVRAAGAIIQYLEQTQKGALGQLPKLSTYSTDSYMVLDSQTRRNLELFQSSHLGKSGRSLLSLIDLTKTPMGGRVLKRWLGQPLLDVAALGQRHDAVAWFEANTTRRIEVAGALGQLGDMERLVNRVRSGVAAPRELLALRRGLEAIPQIRAAVEGQSSPLSWLAANLKNCDEAVALISRAIAEDSSASLGEGGVIKPGFSPELDELRSTSHNAKQYLADLERRERERTGIKSLKVGYNKVFGYYIEVSGPHLSRIPDDYLRKQTLVGAERFFTTQLKEYESLILNARERIAELEMSLFRQVCRQVGGWWERILAAASAMAGIDILAAFAELAVRRRYVRPVLTADNSIHIAAGRHPVVEEVLDGVGFVPNDTHLSNDDCQLVILTGPNMSGKSTYLRQVALIVLLAQIGSFVPCESATMGLVDRIFTRIGLMDDLATGRSTFMIEMTETANILNNATPRSLIILDEIGRGTSTYDGLSIAHAVAEFLHNHPRLGSKTLFATHYHELVRLAGILPRVRNFNVAVVEEEGKVVFLRKIVPGGADRSYGIHVAQLAGLPKPVVSRAEEILRELEDRAGGDAKHQGARRRHSPQPIATAQLALFGRKPEVLAELENLDVDSLTPLEAITKLYELQKRAREED